MNDVQQAVAVTPEPWERQPGERMRPFRAFQCFRDLGPQRTILKVADALYPRKDGTAWKKHGSHGRLAVWSQKWSWIKRAQAWDSRKDRELREADLKAVAEMYARHTKAWMEIQDTALQQWRDKAKDPDLTARGAINVLIKAIE